MYMDYDNVGSLPSEASPSESSLRYLEGNVTIQMTMHIFCSTCTYFCCYCVTPQVWSARLEGLHVVSAQSSQISVTRDISDPLESLRLVQGRQLNNTLNAFVGFLNDACLS